MKGMNMDITFANPEFFFLGLIIPLLVVWYIFTNKKNTGDVLFSNTEGLAQIPRTLRQRTRIIPFILRLLALAFFIIAMARPQGIIGSSEVKTEGIDIVLSMDVSVSMLAMDFKPNRLESSKKIAEDFVTNRPNDRIGLVAFSGESMTMCPLTTDQSAIINQLSSLKDGMLPDGTAIGMGLATAVSSLKNSESKSKVVILLTDGVNNAGVVSPSTSAEIAKAFGIRVYTIGVGKLGKARSPIALGPDGSYIFDMVDVEIDEQLLKEVSEMTGGKYFRAENEDKLVSIYNEIDQMEKNIVKVMEFQNKPDKFWWFVAIGTILMMIEWILRLTYYKQIP
jgi:Ca-activated chloride channel family protein